MIDKYSVEDFGSEASKTINDRNLMFMTDEERFQCWECKTKI